MLLKTASFRLSYHNLLAEVSQRNNKRKNHSKSIRKLAQRESIIHQKIARSQKYFQYKTAHKLPITGKKVFFHIHTA